MKNQTYLFPSTQHHRCFFIAIFLFLSMFLNQVNSASISLQSEITSSESIEPVKGSNLDSSTRMKRSGISDQRLAELETLLALKRMRDENLKNRMVAFGLFDPEQIGRRRRRSSNEDMRPSSFSNEVQRWKPNRFMEQLLHME